MSTILRSTVGAALASAAAAVLTLTAPQASAAERPAAPSVEVAPSASAETKAFAKANPAPTAAAATVCGTGYTLNKAIPLPVGTDPSQRLATLFSYTNGGKGCAILDNNYGASQYMYLKVCKVDGTGCDTDSGNFSEYAGPVYVSSIACAPVTAKMGKTSSSLYINYSSDYVFPCN
ncbi:MULTISPECIES: hypothetical protein [Streptomyces]|uniref:Uncharacterized protein n=1 Tax=Streptomyces melanosporofaciens TaxID=67327 RepID=A0A1H4NT32_STRMJ|nr:hypothetical protein [Streptomyces melanosporofaciens]SEB98324.1 hypothetical protein SAMN04490356_2448 [Streptomyces melanosporofaciens]